MSEGPTTRTPGHPVLVVGVIGGIGSGKSEVARILAEEAGGRVISGDRVGHEVLREPDIREQVVRRWGEGILDAQGEVDRKKLGGIVFADKSELQSLETRVHPRIKECIREELEAARRDGSVPLVVLDAAIMVEAGWADVCDRLVFVEVPWEVRLERVVRARGWSASHLGSREKAQLPLNEKVRRANHVLDNAGSVEALRQQVRDLLVLWGIPTTPNRPLPGT
jgi:dephospho-CoA kinase